MSKDNVVALSSPEEIEDPLTELLHNGAKRLIQQAIEAELADLLARYTGEVDEQGRRTVVRNGYLPEREILTGVGPVSVKVPKVRSRGEEAVVFRSSLVPPYVRKARRVEAALPWLYLKGISTGQMQEALEVLVGSEAKGLSASVIGRLKRDWEAEYTEWCCRDVSRDRWVYWWADGIYSGLRAERQKLCALVIIGVNERGEKHFLAIEDGVRESTQSWREVLLDLKKHGLEEAPKLAAGDGALGFWAALDEVYPETRHQRCWVHKTANVLNYLPKGVQPKAKKALQEIWMAENRASAHKALAHFVKTYQAKYPKAVACLEKDREALLAFYDFPAEHWVHIRTTNPIESTFATIRHRTDQTKGCVSRNTMLAMLYKLGMSAEKRWRRIRGFNYLAKIIEGVKFRDGVEEEVNNETDDSRNVA
ncbi:IS256 family transposase [Thiolapillus brandeum]|uniref:Mutator family transposase n=1 Tax=Thiolapillus brandeum TaxID=1076588 RepID=A0A7U6GLC7_9GAMM|nr:IS256 family transposase [Thiolapillus brandeum]BAO42975.1 transposase, mutator type [Thiolapillus brandeum]BAO43182.1 transposase, mutator type [Thiolapillus brandeum]BAO44387.1 transposase, mutator type [Thiolapillus brandeum]BAO44409.1 transposase, mutator type [Thiolapillus brandeum]BAO44920.1 transposase, mutator type [Thiolapillus brandeum]